MTALTRKFLANTEMKNKIFEHCKAKSGGSQAAARLQVSLSNSAAEVKEFSYSREVRNEEKRAAAFYQAYCLQRSSAFRLYFSASQKGSCRLNCSLSLFPLHSRSLGPSSRSNSSVIQVLDLQMIRLSHLLQFKQETFTYR